MDEFFQDAEENDIFGPSEEERLSLQEQIDLANNTTTYGATTLLDGSCITYLGTTGWGSGTHISNTATSNAVWSDNVDCINSGSINNNTLGYDGTVGYNDGKLQFRSGGQWFDVPYNSFNL